MGNVETLLAHLFSDISEDWTKKANSLIPWKIFDSGNRKVGVSTGYFEVVCLESGTIL